ncbi:phosphoribosylformylglycinamidine synthase subunit PurL [Brevibacterium sp. CS2]|uniref:phosphoribosylformylglycinamidine synthase subunit PurL n=1 Tax=Brevibacterium sp. CS2 TaxID=2575923 RepID=UPI0010C7AF9D|nr:phosphoribosylformylglycinamidine synthase subunit PurL [Brevibacterium sp. CS2]QCP05152.1 phosphoribosylformylglycinamidine synthase subunit PurL [Brevibacterium sp. CS2]
MSTEFNIETVEQAAAAPEVEQPWAELGLKENEYQRIREILGRRPTAAELAMYSVMWSEHCSYKSSKVHLRQFGEKVTQEMNKDLMVGIGENAGVTDLGEGWAVTFKIESHNHPSYVEPYQGAATGIGGIVRDIISMGARPVAVMDFLRFGDIDHPDTKRVLPGVVSGIGGYGNSLGLPNIGGEVVFDEVYQQNPLVNALAVGVMRHEDLRLANASGVGNKVVLFGARTGGDGIGGASVLASESFDDAKPSKRPAVQVGDPFSEKVLIECCLELFGNELVEGIQDLGAAGISCATSELASNGEGGMHVELTNVLLRDPTLTPGEILMSESQERMMAVVTPQNVEAFKAVMAKWGVEYSWLGEVTDTGRLIIEWDGETIVDVDPRTVAHDGPVYERPYHRPAWQDQVQADSFRTSEAGQNLPTTAEELGEAVVGLMSSPNMADVSWITDQYDRFVGGNTALSQPDDAGVIRVDEETGLGVGLATDCNGRYAYLDPYTGAQLALAEAYRNVTTSGAVPMAVSDCLNFGSPEDPEIMWQFAEAVRGLADGCQALGIPVTGGNVSLYNQTAGRAIHPTPVVGVMGKFDDVGRRTPSGFQRWADGQAIYLLGTTGDELDGSEFARLRGHLGGRPPAVDLAAEKTLGEILINASRDGMIDAAHDLSEGGLAAALAEMSLRFGVGSRTSIVELCERDGVDPFTALFSESQARALVALPRSEELRFTDMTTARGFPALRLGVVDAESGGIEVAGPFDGGSFGIGLDELKQAWSSVLPSRFDAVQQATEAVRTEQ